MLPLVLLVAFGVAVVGCKGKKINKPGKGPTTEAATSAPAPPEKPSPIPTPSKKEEEKELSVKKTQEDVRSRTDKTQEGSTKIQPKEFKKTVKEEQIAKGAVRQKGDYPTFDDIVSSWNSEKKKKMAESGGKMEEEKLKTTQKSSEEVKKEGEKKEDEQKKN